ncbi:sensor histidine kinase [Minicystis rosea]|nr:sensor histidine kinase [Minicystis rosea]
MSTYAALALYPLWAVAMTVLATAFRLGRETRVGLLAVCFSLALWVTGLILLESPRTAVIAEHVVPAGIVVAASFVHATADLIHLRRRAVVWISYACSAAITLLGIFAPRALYRAGARGPGPLFAPIAILSALASAALVLWLLHAALAVRGTERRRRGALALGAVLGALGGGGVIGLRVYALGDVWLAAPLLLVAILLTAYAVLSGEHGRARRIMEQSFVYALFTAALSAVGLTVFYRLVPYLSPGEGRSIPWVVLVMFLAALPLDPVRIFVVENLGRRLFADPIGVRDLADQVERTEVRADQAERLAEIGRLASAVAHEIRNPLGVIAAQAKLLERQGAKPETIASMRAQIERARHFLDDLLRYSKPRPLEMSEVEALPALSLVATNVRQIMGDAAPDIEVALEGDDAIFVEVDRGAFTDVATVLVHNAAIALEGRTGGQVRVTAARDAESVVVRVEDDGPGVPQEIEATLFQPFVTGRGRDAKHPGTGLGLAIAARWVERHGGTIRHERCAEGGARFVVRWPRAAGRPLGSA